MNQHPLRTPLEHLQTELDRVPPSVATDPMLEEVRHTTTDLLAQTARPRRPWCRIRHFGSS